MKVAKIIGWSAGSLILLGAAAAGLALTPAVQTWAVRRAVAGQPGLHLSLGRVAAGLSSAELQDIRFEQDGMIVTAKAATARYAAWDYLRRGEVNVAFAHVEGLTVDLRGATPATPPGKPSASTPAGTGPSPAPQRPVPAPASQPPGKPEPFTGLLAGARLPFPLRLDAADVAGQVLLSPQQTVAFELKASGIATDAKGKLEWKVAFRDATAGAPLESAQIDGSGQLQLAADGRLVLVDLDTTAAAHGPRLPSDRLSLQVRAAQPTAASGESYAVNLALLRGAAPEPLLRAEAALSPADHALSGTWEATVRSGQLAAVLDGLGLPELATAGRGTFSYLPTAGAATARGELRGSVTRLGKVAPELAAVGGLDFLVRFDGGLDAGRARLEQLQVELATADGRRLAQVSTSQKVGYDLAAQRVVLADPAAELARLSVQALPVAWAQPFVPDLTFPAGDLSLAVSVGAEADGSRLRARTLEPVTLRNLTVVRAGRPLVEKLTLTTGLTVDHSPQRLTAELPDLRITLPAGDTLEAKLSADLGRGGAKPTVTFSADTQLRLVAAHRPFLPLDPGPLAVRSAVQGTLAGDTLTVGRATTQVSRDGGALLAAVELVQALTANLAAGTFTLPKPAEAAGRVRLGEVPLAWADAFVPGLKSAGTLAGTSLEVSARSAEDVTVTTTEPLVIRGATAALNGRPLLRGLDLTTTFQATRRGPRWAYQVRSFDLREGKVALANLTVKGEAALGAPLTLSAQGRFEADAAALLTQPAAAGSAALAKGQVTSTFDVTLGTAIAAKVSLAARGLVAQTGNQALGDLTVDLEASLKDDASGTFQAPLRLANAKRTSDLTLGGTFGRTKDRTGLVFEGRVAGNQLFVDDFLPLAALAPSGGSTAAPAPSAPAASRPTAGQGAPGRGAAAPTVPAAPARDPHPFWRGVQGKLAVDLKQAVYGQDYTVRNVRGTLTVTEGRLAVDGLDGLLNQDPFKLAAAVTFSPQQPKPYALTGSASIQNLDVGHLLKSANPAEPPPLECRFAVTSTLGGSGATVADLARNVHGRFELNGGKGVLRALARKGDTGQLVNVASAALQILGAARGSNTAVALGELARAFNEVPFDRIKVQVERAPDLSFKIGALELVSPVLRTTGTGTLAGKPGVEITDQVLDVNLQLAAKGNLGYLLQRAGALGGQQDDQGYYLVSRPFHLGGTAGNPDSSALWKFLGQLAAGGLLR